MEAVRREDDDGGARAGGDGGGNGGRAEEVAAAPPSQPAAAAALHPITVSAKQQRERHVVTWTQQEDDLLREQVGIHGTENWACIASQFKDRTGRQCRRRWYSYLNTDCKKGGWSQEEDMILCEAQKIFGNRWTEIAKVVSGRTDNAVKNRFTTLCKRRAKHNSMSKENNSPYPTNNEKFVHQTGSITDMPSESSSALKRMRYQIASLAENENMNNRPLGQQKMGVAHMRPPLAVLVENFDNVGVLPDDQHNTKKPRVVQEDGNSMNNILGSLVRRDGPKILVLMQQAELLSSLAQKVHNEITKQGLENACKELKDYLIQNGVTELTSSDVSQVDLECDDLKGLIEQLRHSIPGNHPSGRKPDIYGDSNHSSENCNGSIHDLNVPTDATVLHTEESSIQHDSNTPSLPEDGKQIGVSASEEVELQNSSLDSMLATAMSPCEEIKENYKILSALPNVDFRSPLHTMPLFRPFTEGIPSPKFSASERQFLLSALGLPSSSPDPNNPSHPPSCKRTLLHSL